MPTVNFSALKLMYLILFPLLLFGGMKEASAQTDFLRSKRLVNGDTVMTEQIAPFRNPIICFNDSSNSTIDSFKVYLVNTAGDEVLATMIKLNDTTANSVQIPKSLGIIFPGDNTTTFYQIQVTAPYKIKIVRTNVGSINGTLVNGKVSHIDIYAIKPTGILKTEYKDYSFQNIERKPGVSNPGFY